MARGPNLGTLVVMYGAQGSPDQNVIWSFGDAETTAWKREELTIQDNNPIRITVSHIKVVCVFCVTKFELII